MCPTLPIGVAMRWNLQKQECMHVVNRCYYKMKAIETIMQMEKHVWIRLHMYKEKVGSSLSANQNAPIPLEFGKEIITEIRSCSVQIAIQVISIVLKQGIQSRRRGRILSKIGQKSEVFQFCFILGANVIHLPIQVMANTLFIMHIGLRDE